jgi:hypothetical protein
MDNSAVLDICHCTDFDRVLVAYWQSIETRAGRVSDSVVRTKSALQLTTKDTAVPHRGLIANLNIPDDGGAGSYPRICR